MDVEFSARPFLTLKQFAERDERGANKMPPPPSTLLVRFVRVVPDRYRELGGLIDVVQHEGHLGVRILSIATEKDLIRRVSHVHERDSYNGPPALLGAQKQDTLRPDHCERACVRVALGIAHNEDEPVKYQGLRIGTCR